MTPGVALVLGTSGVTGAPLTEQLLTSGWSVYGVSRRPPVLGPATPIARFAHLPIDLKGAGTLQTALRGCADITHIFDRTSAGSLHPASMVELLDVIEGNARGLSNINLMQGMKYYGCHLGPFRTPAQEDDPRVGSNDFYYAQEDMLRQRQCGKSWSWTALRPHSVCGYAAGNPLNLALVIAVYATIRRELGEALFFPASSKCFDSWFQVMDADLLASASIHIATTRACANNAYNINNGNFFRWQDLWPAIAGFFKLKAEGPGGQSLADFLALHGGTWRAIEAQYGLQAFPIGRAPAWVRGDYTAPNSRFAAEYNIISDTAKIRCTGFSETIDNETMFLRLLGRYRADRIIP